MDLVSFGNDKSPAGGKNSANMIHKLTFKLGDAREVEPFDLNYKRMNNTVDVVTSLIQVCFAMKLITITFLLFCGIQYYYPAKSSKPRIPSISQIGGDEAVEHMDQSL